MNILMTLTVILFFASCTVDVKSPLKVVEIQKMTVAADSDGDGIDDDKETDKGSRPMIADLPRVSVDFVGGHKFTLSYRDLEQEDDTEIKRPHHQRGNPCRRSSDAAGVLENCCRYGGLFRLCPWAYPQRCSLQNRNELPFFAYHKTEYF